MNMSKKIKIITVAGILLFSSFSSRAFAKEAEIIYQPYELDLLIHNIEKPTAPIITDDYIIFTADVSNRNVGIVFDFEDYKTIHPYKLLNGIDMDGNKTPKLLFYCYERKHKLTTIKYRVIMDGLWTYDPLNSNKYYDEDMNLYLSYIEDAQGKTFLTEKEKDDCIHFIYKGEKGLTIHLAGTFTNWDPWIYTLNETRPGFYELNLPLPRGKYYYNYYIGLTPIVDNTNPNKAYTTDGRTSSVLFVD